MFELNAIIITVAFLAGLIAGVALTIGCVKFAFWLSYEIRQIKTGEETVFEKSKEPPEFELLDNEQENEENEELND